jgi:hypothetical protein
LYEGQSVNRSQMDIKRKTCDIQTWKKHLFLDISSTNIDTLFKECILLCISDMWVSWLVYCCVWRKLKLNILIHLSHCITSASKPVAYIFFFFYCCLSHFCTFISMSSSSAKRLPRFLIHLWTAFREKHFPPYTGNLFFMHILRTESFCPQKRTTECSSWVVHSSNKVTILTTETSLWTYTRTSAT